MKKYMLMFGGALAVVLALVLTPVWAQGGLGEGGEAPMPPPGRPGGGPGGPMGPALEKMDANQDGAITFDEYSAAWIEFTNAHFARMDANGDGVLSKEETAKRPNFDGKRRDGRGARRAMGEDGPGMPPPRPQDGNDAGMPPGPPHQGRAPREMGPKPPSPDDMDADQNGNVTPAEFNAAWDAFSETLFAWLDTDGDGALSADEQAKMRGPRPGPNQRDRAPGPLE